MGANDSPTTTRSIITDYFDWRLNNKTITNNRLFLIVRKIASESETAYYNQQSTFNFNISPTTIIDDQTLNNIKSLHKEIGKELLNEGGITWGRIITFIAFSALLAEHILQQSNNSTRNLIISSIIDWTTEFIDTELQSWLQSQNDWVRRQSKEYFYSLAFLFLL